MTDKVMPHETIEEVVSRLKEQGSPLSLQEARDFKEAKKEMAKKERRDSINFIRSRTSSRASALGRLGLEEGKEGKDVDYGKTT